ncbi:uncharacterized protein LOC108718785 [Xenopus laevis]|uniref:Uncharacterized protein LOC108718785 n=2 Tax=Xenopus laevis TaxID=8355 RepID=A0A1L8FVI9_XENLA|nr:uncharacterized protein LOC108718785 [Xenopus laevis]OCT75581.1 hypothetical protein XELAEV_18030763mg [Xenopus laevis]
MLGSGSWLRWLLLLLFFCTVAPEGCPEGTSCTNSPPESDSNKHCVGARCPARTSRNSRPSHHPSSSSGRVHLLHPAREESLGTGQGPTDTWGVHQPSSGNNSRDCKGIECKLPLRIRLKSRGRAPCVGEGCPAVEGQRDSQGMVRLSDRAAHFIGEVPDFQHGTSELGAAPLGVQLTCDIKPGENEVPSEDALILQLQLAKGQEKFVELLKSQQKTITDLQQKLSEQQVLLVNQQREIIEQQRKMYEQMDMIKVQYSILFDTVKQMSFQSLQEDIQNYFEAHLQGLQNQVRNHLQKTYSVHKVDVDAKVIDVGGPLLACDQCESDEFCNIQKTPPQCEKCTLCPAGFFQLSECSETVDRICQDRDECMDSPSICGEKIKCLNTPGGFRCLGVAEKDAALGLCGEQYFFNKELQECQACSECEEGVVSFPCTADSDTVCSDASESKLSESWSANISLPSAKLTNSQVYPGLNLKIKEKQQCEILSPDDNKLIFKQHGLLWADLNFAVKHNCRNFLQLSLKMNNSEEGYELSGSRIEQPDGKYFQSTSISCAAEVEPGHKLSVFLKSPNQFCNQSKDLHIYDLNTPLSVFWLSHDTGAVAMTAQMSTAMHYQTNYRPTFKIISVSDPYMISLSHDGRSIKFTESGVVKFVFQQALYSMGPTCVREGFSLISYINRNGTNSELMHIFKSGVNYRDTSISASGAGKVSAGDVISFEITSPAQCNVRYFGENSGISILSLIWIPTAISTAVTAKVSSTGLPTGAVRNKLLHFQDPSKDRIIKLVTSGQFAHKYFMFAERGTVSISLHLKLIHSCNILKLTLNKLVGDQGPSAAVTQQIGGQMPEGSLWTSVSFRFSFDVQNGTKISVSLDCVRGRINQIAHDQGTNFSILWVSS